MVLYCCIIFLVIISLLVNEIYVGDRSCRNVVTEFYTNNIRQILRKQLETVTVKRERIPEYINKVRELYFLSKIYY